MYCGRYFAPDARVGDRQKCCDNALCRSKRKKESQQSWLEKNPDYFLGRYENTRQWRDKNPNYQKRWRQKRREIQDEIVLSEDHKSLKSRIKRATLIVPVDNPESEIQDEMPPFLAFKVLVLLNDSKVGIGREIQDEMEFLQSMSQIPQHETNSKDILNSGS